MGTNKNFSSLVLALCLSCYSFDLVSQLKYWISFNDKAGTPYTTSNPSAFLTQKSVQRRTTYNIPIHVSDLPVNPSYISQVASVPNVTVMYASKWLNGVVVAIPNKTLAVNALSSINSFSFVLDTSRVKKFRLNVPEPVNNGQSAESNFNRGASDSNETSYDYGGSYTQNKQLNVICLHENGYRGQGMTIAVMDAGFFEVNTGAVFDSLRTRGGIVGTRNFADGGTDVYLGGGHGTAVLSCIAGNIPGVILGSAPLADFWLLRTEESQETISEEYNWIRAAEFADSVGCDILTTSLGYTDFDDESWDHTYATLTGRKAPMSIAANMAARKGMFVLNAAGNEGINSFHYISVPGDADSICTVGSVNELDEVSNFSSVGPTFDGRIKPELVARGKGAWVGVSGGFPADGTSFATPILAGAVACFWQAHRQYNNMKVLDTLKKGANNRCSPNNSRGWGLPKMCPEPVIFSSKALLDNKNKHDGIKVKFIANSPTAHTDSTFTNSDGTYTISLSEGKYMVVLSKNYYQSVYYNDSLPVNVNVCMGSWDLATLLGGPPVPPRIEFDFTAYADAFKDKMTIQLTDAGYDYVTVDVFDLAGRIILSAPSDAAKTTVTVDISNMADGVYLVKVKTSKGTRTKKVLKRK